MTAKQKAAREKFKKVVAEASKLRKKNPKLTQAQAVKQAWAISYSKAGISKKSASKKKKVGALPIDFKGNFLGYRFKVLNQYQLDGGVTAQLVELDGRGDIITELSGNTRENDRAAAVLYSGAIASGKDIYLDDRDKKDLQKRIKSFVVGLNKEVAAYNTGKDTSKKKSKGLKIVYKPETKKLAVIDRIKSILKENKKILKGGYTLKSGQIREKKVAGFKQRKYLGAAKSNGYHKDTKSHNVNIRVVSGIPPYKDADAAREIELYADNDSRLYFSRKLPILKNLQKKYQKGQYDVEKAAKLWLYYINDAMQRYNKEFGSRGSKWSDLLSVADRKLLAIEYAKETLNEFEQGNFII